MYKKDSIDGRQKRGIYILPNLFTSASLFCGFYAVVASFQGRFLSAAIAILISFIFDGMDGRVARLTGTTSKFGVEYDSLADLVAFGVAPAILAFTWGLSGFGRLGWLAAFLYVATTALRLARFNVLSHSGVSSKSYFLGLPCPAAAAMVATTVLMAQHLGIVGPVRHFSVLIMIYVLSFLMVSSVRYPSFKDSKWLQRRPFTSMVGFILAFMILAIQPKVTLFWVSAIYVATGPVLLTIRLFSPIKSKASTTTRSPKAVVSNREDQKDEH